VEISGPDYPALTIENLFPIDKWTQAYEAHRYYVRVYSYSEYFDLVRRAARKAMESKIHIMTDEFYQSCLRKRETP